MRCLIKPSIPFSVFFLLLSGFLYGGGIKGIVKFDGKAPNIKKKEMQIRKKNKQKAKLTEAPEQSQLLKPLASLYSRRLHQTGLCRSLMYQRHLKEWV